MTHTPTTTRPRPLLTLASDFGTPYPAAMRGVIRRRTDADLLDVSHELPRGDPLGAAFWLRFVLPEFPPAVHCAVVDPGVGTERDAVAVRAGAHVVVAPDNGLALPPARALAADSSDGVDTPSSSSGIDVYRINGFDPASATFHGRDVFAPAAADIAAAIAQPGERAVDHPSALREALEDLDWLTRVDDYVDCEIPAPTRHPAADGLAVDGEVLVVDDFGNAITNVPGTVVEAADRDRIRMNDTVVPVVETFADVDRGEKLVTVGSHGYVECDVNDGSGAASFGLSPGDAVRIRGE